jgi:hypothetical protein
MPESAAGTFPDRSRVESVVDDVFDVFAITNLSHKPVLVPVHSRQISHMGEYVLKSVSELKGVYIPQPELHMGVHDQFCQSQDFPTEVKRISETGFLPFLGGQSLHGFKIEIIVQMKIVQVLTMDEQIHHVEALSTNLESAFHPI